ncbi:MAG: nucleoid-associated protein, partial [Bacteroidetes bacterium]|nr:nucleoid-associated protein [Bacteroidota bacterium]
NEVLLTYFIKPFHKSNDIYHFQHITDLSLNEVYTYSGAVFDVPYKLREVSEKILKFLYEQSDHPNIKSGEVYVAYFQDILIDDELVDGLGIFKSERKISFLQVSESGDYLEIKTREGISVEKLDKGCLVLNTEKSDGFRVLTVDNNNYDSLYWPHRFLGVDFVEDDNFHTKLYLEMCNEFSREVVAPQSDKREQLRFMNSSVDYFTKNETFDLDDFSKNVLPDENMRGEFKEYREDFALDDVDNFNISKHAIRTVKRKIKNNIKLDTHIQIKLSFPDPKHGNKFIEKGYDEERGMHFYKLYFNKEME